MHRRLVYVLFAAVVCFALNWFLSSFSLWTFHANSDTESLKRGSAGFKQSAQQNESPWKSAGERRMEEEQLVDDSLLSAQARPTMPAIPLVYVITPTFWRLEQKAELTRTANALRGTPRLHWIVIEDSVNRTELVTNFLQNCGVNYTHLFTRTPTVREIMRLYNVKNIGQKHKGVLQRNEGLDWLIQNAEFPSVLYFADDDNTYDPRIFEEVRYTQRVSVFPVGLVGGSLYEAPVVKHGKIVDWITSFPGNTFSIDMAGFAVNTAFYIKAGKPKFNIVTKRGTIENGFLEDIHISKKDLEPKADNCTKVWVWHTKTYAGVGKRTIFERIRNKHSQPLLEV